VCGNQDYGWCCPASAPVACVDQTGGGCFPAGTTCCAQTGGTTHCGPGDVCVNNGADCCPAGDVYAGGGCCPANEVYGPGLCCAEPTCGGVCCTGGTCVNNECQMPNLSGGICNPTPYTPVPASNTSVESSWVGTWMDTTAAVTVTIGADAKAGFDVQTSEAQSACGGGAEPAITSSAAGAGDGAIANMSSWLATIATACVASPPTLPTSEPFQLSEYKTIQLGSGGNTIYLTLYSYSCVGSSTPQYVVRYTRVGSVGQVYSDYMLNLQAKLQ
jgi:hypothetical protein